MKDEIIDYLLRNEYGSSSDIHTSLSGQKKVSLVTIKRLLSALKADGLVILSGKGPSTKYRISARGRLTASIDVRAYGAEEPDKRYGFDRFNHDLFPALDFNPFTENEQASLVSATEEYRRKAGDGSPTTHQKELERFIIELSWKSSRIEGNTYTLLDTERLIKEGIEAPGHSKDEAMMVLNHKAAFSFVYEHRNEFKELSRTHLQRVHELLSEELPIQRNFRTSLVGVTGSRYQPLDNQYQIGEAIDTMRDAIARMKDGYAKALVALLGISYIQPFEDGNKRTARLTANALLLAYGLCPLSYRSVDEVEYRETMLVFYELNSFESFKKIFIEQYRFAAETYALA
jgi:fido (protein-threonine AMPylation protein)